MGPPSFRLRGAGVHYNCGLVEHPGTRARGCVFRETQRKAAIDGPLSLTPTWARLKMEPEVASALCSSGPLGQPTSDGPPPGCRCFQNLSRFPRKFRKAPKKFCLDPGPSAPAVRPARPFEHKRPGSLRRSCRPSPPARWIS